MRPYVEDVRSIQATLEPASGTCAQRQARFEVLQEQFHKSDDAIQQHMGHVMGSFAPGLFVGGEEADKPKGHERRIHGRQHAGVRIVQEGPTLLLALDAHLAHPEPFTGADLWPYHDHPAPACQRQALHRRTMMRRARSKKQRPVLLAELERRYLDSF